MRISQKLKPNDCNTYREKLFSMLSLTRYFRVTEVGKVIHFVNTYLYMRGQELLPPNYQLRVIFCQWYVPVKMNLYPVFRSTPFIDTVKALLSIFITNIYMDVIWVEFSELYLRDILLSLGTVEYGTKVWPSISLSPCTVNLNTFQANFYFI